MDITFPIGELCAEPMLTHRQISLHINETFNIFDLVGTIPFSLFEYALCSRVNIPDWYFRGDLEIFIKTESSRSSLRFSCFWMILNMVLDVPRETRSWILSYYVVVGLKKL